MELICTHWLDMSMPRCSLPFLLVPKALQCCRRIVPAGTTAGSTSTAPDALLIHMMSWTTASPANAGNLSTPRVEKTRSGHVFILCVRGKDPVPQCSTCYDSDGPWQVNNKCCEAQEVINRKPTNDGVLGPMAGGACHQNMSWALHFRASVNRGY